MPDQPRWTEQQLADILGITVEEHNRRRIQREIREEEVRATQRAIERAAEQARSAHVTINRNILPTLDRSYADEATVAAYTNRYRQNIPIYNDFDSSFAYNIFMKSKHKHHHKCNSCQAVFRCGHSRCTRRVCSNCESLEARTSSVARWSIGYNTNEDVRILFNGDTVNGAIGGRWNTGYTVAYDEAVPVQPSAVVAVDYANVERRILSATSFLADLAPERSTEEES